MKHLIKLAPISLCLAGLSCVTDAAPATSLPNEWFVPMEQSDRFAFVDKSTGQVRFFSEFNGTLLQTGPLRSDLSDITGLSSGFVSGGNEYVILSSIFSNRVAFLAENETQPRYLFPSVPGPELAFPLNVSGNTDEPVFLSSLYGPGANSLELIEDPFSAKTQLDLIDPINAALRKSVPLRDPVSGDQLGMGIFDSPTPDSLISIFRSGDAIEGANTGDNVAMGSQLTTEVIGNDGRICTIAYVPGQPVAEIFTHTFGGFTENLAPSLPLSFGIGSIAPIPYGGIPNASEGVLITSADGTEAVYALVVPNGPVPTEFEFTIVQAFSPSGDDLITGLLPIPGEGIVAFQSGNDLVSTNWHFFTNTGSGWNQIASGELSPWLSAPSTDFATLFWYNSTPLVDPTAELLQLDIVPDWTLGGGTLPTSLERETFVGSSSGLDNPSAYATAAPTGATHVMTSQIDANASVASLADTFSLSIPSLIASPESGTYNTAVTFTLLFDDQTAEAFFRRTSENFWTQYTEPLTIGYPTELIFYARDLTTGKMGPIQNRSFSFSVDLNSIDSDNDGVPDYVEEARQLDPFGGADTDLDFQPDLEEILGYEIALNTYQETDPNDPLSNVAPEDRNPPFLGEGFFLYAQAFDSTTGSAAPYDDGGTPTTPPANTPPSDGDLAQQATDRADDTEGTNLFAYDMRSTLLTRNEVKEITSGTLAGSDAARMDVTSNLPDHEWLILSTPTYFGLGSSIPAPRDGRETFRILQNPAFDPPSIVTVPTGTDLQSDADAWIAAARTAYSSFDPVTQITRIDPVDTIIATLGEQALFSALDTLSTDIKSSLEVPSTVDDWTLFGSRDGEAAKTNLSQDMLEALLDDGCDFQSMLQVIDTEVRASADLPTLANTIYDRHVATSDANPLMALPLDAWRSILRSGSIVDPAPGDPARTDPFSTIPAQDLADAQTELLAILALALDTKRPTEQWTLFIEEPTTPGHRYDYRRLLNNNLAWLTDASGERFILEQGLGLNIGTSYTLSGYTDVDPVTGFDTMEIISIDSIVTPVATDNDTNANLLDDAWEQFFFGEIGAVDAYDEHPDTGHSYLQYQISGADPRAGDLAEPIYNLFPTEIEIIWSGEPINTFEVQFTFPDEYVDAFVFGLVSSQTLESASFVGPADNGLGYLSEDRYGLTAKTSESNFDQNFFRITVGLQTSD